MRLGGNGVFRPEIRVTIPQGESGWSKSVQASLAFAAIRFPLRRKSSPAKLASIELLSLQNRFFDH